MKVKELYKDRIVEAVESGDAVKMADVMYEMVSENEMNEDMIAELRAEFDKSILASRGRKQMTSAEKAYYEEVLSAMTAREPRQAISNIDKTFPETIINEVFEDLVDEHPLLSKIDFVYTSGNMKYLLDVSEVQKASWGELCDAISQEIQAGLKVVQTGLYKLSAFLYACKPGMELGAAWLDNYVRQSLKNALAAGLVEGILVGDGDDCPIGMNRDLEGTVVSGAYPAKSEIEITNFDINTVGNLLSLIAVNNGKTRRIENLILACNPADYYKKVMPAINLLGADGVYRNILPYPIDVIAEPAVPSGKAIFGLGKRYFASAGIPADGRIEFSDEFKFLDDKRTYVIKTYANGLPKDNNAFLYLDISDLIPATYKVTAVDARVPSDNALLADLKIGSLTLSPTFDPDEDTYTASTTATTNTITATLGEANQTIAILNGSTLVENGTAATWSVGANVVTITVTAEDGTTQEVYTVTVTKS